MHTHWTVSGILKDFLKKLKKNCLCKTICKVLLMYVRAYINWGHLNFDF
jgi:hypothetical protein